MAAPSITKKHKHLHQPHKQPAANNNQPGWPRLGPYLAIFMLTCCLYGNTLLNEYTLDDIIVFTENKITLKGWAGIGELFTTDLFMGYYGNMELVPGSRYRPLSMVTFAIEYELFGKNPLAGHLINVLLYTFCGMVIYRLLNRLFREKNTVAWFLGLPFIATALYIAHPIHTEVVASIKGRDEIMGLLGAMSTLLVAIRFLDTRKLLLLLMVPLLFFFALMSKENAITFLAVFPVTVYCLTGHSFKKTLLPLTAMVVTAGIYLIIRFSVASGLSKEITDIMNDPFIGTTLAERSATVAYTLGLYVKLLLLPHPLTYDYYPYHIPIMNWSDTGPLLSLLVYAGMSVAIIKSLHKTRPVYAYGLLFYLITLSIVSNVFFNIGAFMNERFVFISSLGFSLITAWFLRETLPRWIKNETAYFILLAGAFSVMVTLYSVKTISRNADWKNDFTLTMQDVKTSSNSAKSNASAGYLYMLEAEQETNPEERDALFRWSIYHLEKALQIYPEFVNTMINLGAVHFKYQNDYPKTLHYYLKVLELQPTRINVLQSVLKILNLVNNEDSVIDYKLSVYTRLYKLYPNVYEVNYGLGLMYHYKGDTANAARYINGSEKLKHNAVLK